VRYFRRRRRASSHVGLCIRALRVMLCGSENDAFAVCVRRVRFCQLWSSRAGGEQVKGNVEKFRATRRPKHPERRHRSTVQLQIEQFYPHLIQIRNLVPSCPRALVPSRPSKSKLLAFSTDLLHGTIRALKPWTAARQPCNRLLRQHMPARQYHGNICALRRLFLRDRTSEDGMKLTVTSHINLHRQRVVHAQLLQLRGHTRCLEG